METTEGVGVTRGGSIRIPSPSSSRKEWRAVSDPHSSGNSADNVDLEQLKLDRSDERTMYERGREPVDVDFCSITVEGGSDNDILQQRIHGIARQKEELQQLEIELRAQMIARSEIMEMQKNFETKIKDHANAATKLQEQLHEKERTIRELERRIDDKDRELHAIKLDNEAAWAKEDLLREQNKELATFRRERDHSEAERAQHIQKICELQEHIQEKERQLIELQERNRIAQETILYKDEQLREAQAWITRGPEMDALQSSTNHSLQVELRERTELYNQLWIGCQRQFAEMERLHLHTVQQLQIELANARERGRSFADESLLSRTNSNSTSQIVQSSGNQVEANGSSPGGANNNIHSNGKNSDNIQSSSDDTATQNRTVGVQMAPSSALGMHAYLPPTQITPLHSFVMHQQGIPQPIQPQGPPSHVAQSAFPVSSMHQWPQHKMTGNGQSLGQAVDSGNGEYLTSSQFRDGLRLDSQSPNHKTEEQNDSSSTAVSTGSIVPETMLSDGVLLDERSLLACIVRTMPAGGRIRISSTLPNRLGKMLAPLHWHDYRKKYGKLDDFVASHPELFVIEGDNIQLREGAQKMVAASAAAAKVAAAAAATSSNSIYVAVTPMAQSHGFKKTEKSVLGMNQGLSKVKILTKPLDSQARPGSDFIVKHQGRSIGASAAARR